MFKHFVVTLWCHHYTYILNKYDIKATNINHNLKVRSPWPKKYPSNEYMNCQTQIVLCNYLVVYTLNLIYFFHDCISYFKSSHNFIDLAQIKTRDILCSPTLYIVTLYIKMLVISIS